jgi:hypothetical protein
MLIGGEERGEQREPLVGRALAFRREAVRRDQRVIAGKETERGVRVADFGGKEHGRPLDVEDAR